MKALEIERVKGRDTEAVAEEYERPVEL